MSSAGYYVLSVSQPLCPSPHSYQQGDIVLFHPVKLAQTKVTAPALMHAEKPYPYILMDLNSYSSFGIRPGRM